jgi:molybdopterin/thiamine biosynthesis adenylyltransferase
MSTKRIILREKARVLVVGAGGLGAPAILALAHAGIGTIGIVDDDEVEKTNLHRQILFRESDVGRPKGEAAKAAITRINKGISIEVHPTRFLPHNAIELASMYDLIVEGSDNFPTKFLVADAACLSKRAVVHAAAVRWVGTALAVSAAGAPCYRCVFEDVPKGDAPNCATAGVIGPVVGVVGALQADLALRMIDGEDVAGTLVSFDGRSETIRRHRVAARKSCALCGTPESPKNERISNVESIRYGTAP